MPSSKSIKTKPSRYKFGKWKRCRYRDPLLINTFSVAVFICVLCVVINNGFAERNDTVLNARGPSVPANDKTMKKQQFDNGDVVWREGREGHGTEHEQTGIPHFQRIIYTPFVNNATYTKEETRSKLGMGFIYTVVDKFFRSILTKDPPLPDGYVDFTEDSRIYLGPKAKQNDWMPLLKYYWALLLFILAILILIIAMPFIAVCYCCFCCHRRCGRHCPPCDQKRDARMRCCYGFLMLLLIIGVLFGVIIAFVNNKLLENGTQDSSKAVRRASKDTCTFLESTAAHLRHLYMNNYQEMETQLIAELNNAHKHVFLDLIDVSKGNAVPDLLKILEMMPNATEKMEKADVLEKEIRFFGSQLRDALRGVKRDINYIRVSLCPDPQCDKFLRSHDIGFLDTGCFHYDNLPNSTVYLEAMKDIIEKEYVEIPKRGLQELQTIGDRIKKQMDVILPPIINDIRNGYDVMREQAETLKSLIDSVINDVNIRTMRSMDSFDDIYTKFGSYRNLVNLIVCSTLLLILFCLIISLLCGCCGKRPRGYRDDSCNKGTGATCLLVAMLLIFLTFSIITLIGLMYFTFSMLGYEGACAPMRDKGDNALFKKLDQSIDLAKLLPKQTWNKDIDGITYTEKDGEDNPLQPIRISTTIKACQANQSIYDVLHMNDLYDMRNLRLLKILRDLEDDIAPKPYEEMDLSEVTIYSEDDYMKLNEMRNGNLSTYMGSEYFYNICTDQILGPETSLLERLAGDLDTLGYELRWERNAEAQIAIFNQALHLRSYEQELHQPLKKKAKQLTDLLNQIDDILHTKGKNFQDVIGSLLKATRDSEKFIRGQGKDFISKISENLTQYTMKEVERYRDMVIEESEHKVGLCEPLAYIYKSSVHLVCNRLVEPMSGFWVGTLLCCLLFLPILWVAHKLQCLYKRVDPYAVPVAAVVGGDYLYDAYSEHDQIPMSNAHKKRRKGYDRRREYDYYDDASPGMSAHAPAPANMRDSRYKDMAPQHWDSEPPRYHNPPMAPPASEYERPPPYYYPGAAEQD